MDHKMFKLTNLGVCSYYLIVYSCFQIYAKTFYLEARAGLAMTLLTYGISLLTLSAGILSLFRYRKERAAFADDTRANVSETVELIGGSIILAMMLLHVIRSLCYSFGTLNLFFNPTRPLFSILFFTPFIIVSAVTIGKGLKTKESLPPPDNSVYSCFQISALFVLFTSIYELLLWLLELAAFSQYETRPQEQYWIYVQFVFIAAALILLFAPLNFKNKYRTTDESCGKELTAQSLFICGSIILLNASIKILDFLISIIVFLISDFEEFVRDFFIIARERFAVQLLPDLIFLIIGLAAVLYGNKRSPQS